MDKASFKKKIYVLTIIALFIFMATVFILIFNEQGILINNKGAETMESNNNINKGETKEELIKESKEELKEKYLPKVYTFDDGNLIIKTGDKVIEEKVQRLYWASKEVAAQYFRSINRDQALEPGNPDDILTIIIYNDPEEYKMNEELYGYNTNNGGMYIEGIGTFFTYERTPEQSKFSLEELFRHEFTHYLEGRYVVPGLWGQSEIYENERLTWYEEGQSEFFAGSTRTQGILPRKSIVGNIVFTEESKRYDFKKTLESTYTSGFDFYNYACVAMDFLYHKYFDVYDRLAGYIMENNISEFDNTVNQLKDNNDLNEEFKNYMQQLIDSYGNLSIPLVEDDYLASHPTKEESEILDEIVEVSNIKDAEIESKQSDFFKTFIIKGTYTGGISQGKIKDIEFMNDLVNGYLKTLDDYSWSGYKTLTAYFVNHRVGENNNMVFDIVFHGLLP